MAIISVIEYKKIEKFLTPPATQKGYVLDFSKNSFQEFIYSVAGIDIYEDEKYNDLGDSKAKRLRSFFEKESNNIAGKVLLKLAEYQNILPPEYHSPTTHPDEIIEIAKKLMQGSIDEDHHSTSKIHFDQIREQILNELKKAEFTIWVAVAWFTDPVLFNCLLEKKAQGLNIQVIIHDDKYNNSSNLDYSQFETYKLAPSGYRSMNQMHHKFCIIDFITVIHGSYNWTKRALYNKETIDIDPGYDKAKQFSQEFMKLKLQGFRSN